MKVAIIGNRTIEDRDFVLDSIGEVLASSSGSNIVYLTGGAAGPAKIIEDWCEEVRADCIVFRPWHMIDNKIPFETKLFYMRNKQVLHNADMAIIFSNGEKDSEVDKAVKYAEKIGVPVSLVKV